MTPKQIKQYCKDEAIKKYLLKHAKASIGFNRKNSVKKFKSLKNLLFYGENFRFKRDSIIFTNNITLVSDDELNNVRYIRSSYIEYAPEFDRFFIYFIGGDLQLIIDIKFVGVSPVIII